MTCNDCCDRTMGSQPSIERSQAAVARHSTHTEQAADDDELALEVKELFNRMNNQGKLQIEE